MLESNNKKQTEESPSPSCFSASIRTPEPVPPDPKSTAQNGTFEDPQIDGEEPLMTFHGPSKYGSSLRPTSSELLNKSADFLRKNEEEDRNSDVYDLLNYYRTRCAEFDNERKDYLDRFGALETSHETIHRLKWEVKMRKEEVIDLQKTIRETNTKLFQYKEKVLQLQAENDSLIIQEMEDRKRIQHLLALTQPVTEEVTFFRDCRPGRMTRFPMKGQADTEVSPAHDMAESVVSHSSCKSPSMRRSYSKDSLNLEAERQHRSSLRGRSRTHLVNTKGSSQPRAQPRAQSSAEQGAGMKRTQRIRVQPSQHRQSRVLRTVYLPSEQADTLMRTVNMLKSQLSEQQKMYEERIDTLMNESSAPAVDNNKDAKALHEHIAKLENDLSKAEDNLRHTTKDYLVLRHNSQEMDRKAFEEVSELRIKCKQLRQEKEDLRRQANFETKAIRDAIQQEGDICAQEFRQQAVDREQDIQILKEQYAAVQKTYTQRVYDLQTRLKKVKSKYKTLEKRRNLEMEGFSSDITALRRQLMKIENLYYGAQVSRREKFSWRKGAAKAIKSIIQHCVFAPALTISDEPGTAKIPESEDLDDEIKALRTRCLNLESDINEYCQTDRVS